MKHIALDHCAVDWTDWGCITQFRDGTSIGAHPHDTPHYRIVSHRLGYGHDLLAYCREHEVMHSLVAQWFYRAPSCVLWNLAHGREHDRAQVVHEEVMAQTVQRMVRGGEVPIVAGVDWDGLRALALEVLG